MKIWSNQVSGEDTLCSQEPTGRARSSALGSVHTVRIGYTGNVWCRLSKTGADLVDCGVDVCSPEVLWRYSENFDYQELRRDFVANEVANVELGQKVFARVLGDAEGYGARVHDPRLLDAVSTDVLRRWAYPLTPDAMSHASAACPAKGTARAATAVGRERPASSTHTLGID